MAKLYASADLGGTTIGAVLAGDDGDVVAQGKIDTRSHEGPEGVIGRIAELVNGLAARAGRKPAALGLGVPGLCDLAAGVTRFLPNLPTQWRDVPVRDLLAPRVGCPVFLLNDVRMATLGELVFGHGRGTTDLTMAFFAIGTGIGGGIVIDGKLRLGPLGAAGELGHQTMIPDGAQCGCGSVGCLETLASGPAIAAEGVRLMRSGLAPKLHELAGGDAGKVTPLLMEKAAHAGEASVIGAIERAARWLAIGVANVATCIHPDLIVLGGGVAEMGDLLLEPVRAEARRRIRMFPAETVRIERSRLGDRAGALGGIALAMKEGSK